MTPSWQESELSRPKEEIKPTNSKIELPGGGDNNQKTDEVVTPRPEEDGSDGSTTTSPHDDKPPVQDNLGEWLESISMGKYTEKLMAKDITLPKLMKVDSRSALMKLGIRPRDCRTVLNGVEQLREAREAASKETAEEVEEKSEDKA